ncbi:MAG: ribose 5-phosphate isomerase B [Myxococcota bacterium]
MRRIHVGSDHAAVGLRLEVVAHLRELGHSVTEIGPLEGERCDYPDHAATVARAVSSGASDLGVLVCGTGIGVSIAANKIPGVRAALVHDITTATLAAQHNNANVLCVGGRLLAPQLALELVDAWLSTPFETRHQHRLDKITALEGPTTDG